MSIIYVLTIVSIIKNIITIVALITITIINKDSVIVIVVAAADVVTTTVASSMIIVVITGQTVEMHGNINQLVCPSCGVVVMMTPALLRKLRSKKPVPCTKCDCGAIRCRIMLYDDAAGTCLCKPPLIFFCASVLFFFFFFHSMYCCCTGCRTSSTRSHKVGSITCGSGTCVLRMSGGISGLNSCRSLLKIKLRQNMAYRPALRCASTLSEKFLTDFFAQNAMPYAWCYRTVCIRSSPTAASL